MLSPDYFILRKKYKACPFKQIEPIPENLGPLPLLQMGVPLPEPDELVIENNMGLLHTYCLSRGWPNPSYSVLHHKCPDTHKVMCFASVKVNGDGANTFKIGTLPFEHENENIVKGYAAKIALMKIIEEESKVKADKTINSDTNIICNRISDIVARAPAGLFVKSVEDEYVKRHNELLPPDWLQTVSSWPTVSVESTVNSTVIVPRDPTALVKFDLISAPPPLPIKALGNNKGFEEVYVTHATSISSIWFRVIGKDYSEKYEDLLEDMDRYYKGVGAQEVVQVLGEGHYYVAQKFDTWFRVRIIEVDDINKTVLAWLIDLGGNDIFEIGSFYRLAPQFCKLPQQAVLCILEGIERFCGDDIANEIVATSKLLINQTLVAKISQKNTESGSVKAILYDTSGDDDIDINEQIKEIIEKSKPVLPAEGCAMEVNIGDVSKKGEIYVMFAGPALDYITEIIESLGPEKISEHKLTSFKHISLNKLYLAKYSKDDIWYRAVVTTTPSVQHNKIPVHFIDYGNTESVIISDIADLEKLPPILKKLPPQAVKVALHNLPFETLSNPEVASIHSLLLDEDKAVLLKTVSLTADPPIVEIFTKEADNAALVSVNSKIELQRKRYRNEDKRNLFNTLRSESFTNQFNNKRDEFDLNNPDFSDNRFQPVLIPLSAHPGYFIFHPVKYNKCLKQLRKQMCAYYEAGVLPGLPPERVAKNKLFAARCEGDDMWYRVVVTASLVGVRVQVRLCDFGDVRIINISSLRELAPEFHIYPFMAVKGKLAGVKPVNKGWSAEDCIRFQSLVHNKILAGIIKHTENNQNPMDMVVTLTLVNTSSDKDQYIAEILIDELRAIRDDE